MLSTESENVFDGDQSFSTTVEEEPLYLSLLSFLLSFTPPPPPPPPPPFSSSSIPSFS